MRTLFVWLCLALVDIGSGLDYKPNFCAERFACRDIDADHPGKQEKVFFNLTDEDSCDYNKWLRPARFDGKPIQVNVSVDIHNVAAVVEKESEYSVYMVLTLQWLDYRIALEEDAGCHDRVFIDDGNSRHLERLWSPQMRLIYSKDPGVIDNSNSQIFYLQIFTNGTVSLRQQLYIRHYCDMNFRYYPFDEQMCNITLESSFLSDKHIRFHWSDHEPIRISRNFQMSGFTLMSYRTSEESYKHRQKDLFSRVSIEFDVKREWEHFLFDTYLPSVLFVVVSWLTFWLPATSQPARTSLGVTTMLTLVTTLKQARDVLPRISYIHALDIWGVICIGFIFLSLIEFIIVSGFQNKGDKTWRREYKAKLKEKRKMLMVQKRQKKGIKKTASSVSIASMDSEADSMFSVGRNKRFLTPSPSLNSFVIDYEIASENAKNKAHNANANSNSNNFSNSNNNSNNNEDKKEDKIFTIGASLSVPCSPTFSRKMIQQNAQPPPTPCGHEGGAPPEPPKGPNKWQLLAQKIDRSCRLLFPACFLLVNMLYWLIFVISRM